MTLARLRRQHEVGPGSFQAQAGVRTRRDGHALFVTIDRPTQLNALTHDVVAVLLGTVEDAVEDPEIATIVLAGAGSRAFSAGGDLVFLREDALRSGGRALPFWRDLYHLALTLHESTTPVVSLLDGYALGGGLGVGARAQHRVVTERSVLGMPETRIGFFPDTGGLHLLSHLPGETGTYLALCAEQVGAADALAVGLADHFVWADDLPLLVDRLAILPVDEALTAMSSPPPDAARLPDLEWVDDCFAGDDPRTIADRLARHPEPAAQEAGRLLLSRSPNAVTATLLGLRRASTLDLADDLLLELRLAESLRSSHDFLEGIRARLVDKDRAARWWPATFEDISDAAVRAALGPS